MEATQLEVTFVTAQGLKETKVFTRQPLGMQLRSTTPMVIKGIQKGSPADHLGVKVGWRLHAIAGDPMAGKNIYESYRTLVLSSAPLRRCMLVRPTPLKTASAGMLATKLKSDADVDVAQFLSKFGFVPPDAQSWGDHTSPPELRFTIDGHREMGTPIYHTWYAIVGKLMAGQSSARSWMVERRLVHVRSMLYEPLRREWGEQEYGRYFKDRPFPRRGAPPGTTARLQSWLTALSEAISFGAISPAFTASIFRFLEAPTLHEDAGQSVVDRTHQDTHDGTGGALDASRHDASKNEPDHGRETGVAKRVDAQAHNVLNHGLHQLLDDGLDDADAEQPWRCSQFQADSEAGESSDEACPQDVPGDDGTEQGSDDGVETDDDHELEI